MGEITPTAIYLVFARAEVGKSRLGSTHDRARINANCDEFGC